jgi:hypothetical protein
MELSRRRALWALGAVGAGCAYRSGCWTSGTSSTTLHPGAVRFYRASKVS